MIATFVFAGLLVGVAIGGWFVARATPRNVDPAPVDSTWTSIDDFYEGRADRDDEVDLGLGWTSALDPGASFDLSWIVHTSELVALRKQARPGYFIGSGHEGPTLKAREDPRATGMKVLAVVDEVWVRACHPEDLRTAPDGLDQLTSKLGFPYVPPHPDDSHWSANGGREGSDGGAA